MRCAVYVTLGHVCTQKNVALTAFCQIFVHICAHFHTIITTKRGVHNLFVTRPVKVRDLFTMTLVTIRDICRMFVNTVIPPRSAIFWDITRHNYHRTLLNVRKERGSHLLCGTRLKSHIIITHTILISTDSPFIYVPTCSHWRTQEFGSGEGGGFNKFS